MRYEKNIAINKEIHKKLKTYCEKNNFVMKYWIENLIRKGIKNENTKNKKNNKY